MIRLRLLGSVDLVGDDGSVLDGALRRSKVLAVLAYLAAARPRGFHRRDKITALFWPELPTDRARGALRVTLSRLRDQIGADVVTSRGSDEIGIDTSRIWCDVAALDDALAAGDAAGAASLYRGPLLDGVHIEGTAQELEHWIETERARICEQLVEALMATNLPGDARRATEIAPFDERPAKRWIQLLLESGDQAAALRAYDEFARRLERELDLTPSEHVTTLVSGLRQARGDEAVPIQTRIVMAPVAAAPMDSSPAPGKSRVTRGGVLGSVAAVLVTGIAVAAMSRTRGEPPRNARMTRRWRSVHVTSPQPVGRQSPRAFLDSTNQAVVLFGGMEFGETPADSRIMNDVRRLRGLLDNDLPAWQTLTVEGAPPEPRWLFGLAYDAAHDRAIIHGGARGYTSPCANDTWILSNASGLAEHPRWTKVRIDGALPPPRAGLRIEYDAAHHRIIYVGGHDCFSTFFNDAWVLAFNDSTLGSGHWTHLLPDTSEGAPFGRASYASMYDAAANRLVIQGGNAGGRTAGDMWILEHANGLGAAAWRRARCSGTAPALSSHDGAYDSTSGTWVLFGGTDSTQTEQGTVWRVTGMNAAAPRCAWERVDIGEPQPNARQTHSVMMRRDTRDLVVYGGAYQSSAFRDVLVLPNPFRDPR